MAQVFLLSHSLLCVQDSDTLRHIAGVLDLPDCVFHLALGLAVCVKLVLQDAHVSERTKLRVRVPVVSSVAASVKSRSRVHPETMRICQYARWL